MGTGTEILIVEDSATQAELLTNTLEEAGYRTRIASNGRLALAAARQNIPSLVISNAVMPQMDGFDLCRELKGSAGLGDVPVLLLTALIEPEDIVRGLVSRADYYLAKPFDAAALLATVELLLSQPRTSEAELKPITTTIGGRSAVVPGDPQRILNLLSAIYEQMVQRNRALLRAQDELRALNSGLEQSVAERTAQLKEKEKRLQAVFDATTDTVALLDRDGRFLGMNASTLERFGKSAHEIFGATIDALVPPKVAEARREKFNAAVRSGLPVAFEDERDGLIFENRYCPVVAADGTVEGVAAYAREVTVERRLQRLLQARVRLSEFATSHGLQELLTKALDEAESLTGSSVAFFHLVEADQATLSLQTWSTNTRSKSCTAESSGRHDTVDRDGVWSDAIRERRPLLYQDDSRRPPSRRIPPGHPKVERQLVVPVLRDGLVVALVGVGNKPADYVAADVETVSQLATLAWDLVLHKQAEEALARNEFQLLAIVESTADGILAVDNEGRVTRTNQRFAELWRIPDALIAKRDDQALLSFVVSQLSEPEAFLRKVQSLYHSDATELDSVEFADGRVFERYTEPVLIGGKVAGRVWSFRDISERLRSEERLKRQVALIELAHDAIVTRDPDSVITFWNPAAEELYGWTKQEAVGQTTHGLLRTVFPESREAMDAALETDGQWEGELTHTRRDGSRITVHSRQSLQRDERGKAIAILEINRDITSRKQQEADERQREKTRSLSRMAAAIAHNINNHLTVVQLNLGLLQEELPPESASSLDLTQALQSARAAAGIASEMLTFLGETRTTGEPLDLSEVCREGLLQLQTGRPNLGALEMNLPSPGPVVRADANQLQLVLGKLLTNALEASDGRSEDIRLSVKVVSATEIPAAGRFPTGWRPDDRDYACLEVADSGTGISPEEFKELFEPFFSTKFTGRGLGLPVVLGIVRELGGGITVTSQPGEGSVFRIFLPPVSETAAQAEVPEGRAR